MLLASWLSLLSRSAHSSFAKFSFPAWNRRRHRINTIPCIESLEDRLVLSVSPVFSPNSYSFGVAEDAASNTTVGTVSATDADNDIMGYGITAGDPGSFFNIDSGGNLTVQGSLDFETTSSYTLTVQVYDMEGNSDLATVTVNVTDVAEDPIFNPTTYTFSVAEDAAFGATVGALSATDPQNDISGYSITAGDPSSVFSVDSSGNLTVQGSLDFETTATYTLTVQVQDMGGHSDTATVTVNVTDVAEDPTFSPATYTFSVAEDAAFGTTVGTLSATDPQNDISSYSITAGDPNSVFNVDSAGNVTVQGSLDFETTTTYTLTVQVQDMGGHNDTATVTVNVTDVDDGNHKPTAVGTSKTTFGSEPVAFNPAENATDPDGDDCTAVIVANPTYGSLTNNGDGTFTYVFTAATQQTSDSFTYRAFDGTDQSDNTATVTITIDWATISIVEGAEQTGIELSRNQFDGASDVEITGSVPLEFIIYATLPSGYNSADFELDIEISGPGSAFLDPAGTIPLAPGTGLPLPGPGGASIYVVANAEGFVDVRARLKKAGQIVQQGAQKIKEFLQNPFDVRSKFDGVLSGGKAKLKDAIEDAVTKTAGNTLYKKLSDGLTAIKNDVNQPQAVRDLANTQLNNLTMYKTDFKNAVNDYVFEKTRQVGILIEPKSDKADLDKTVSKAGGVVDNSKWSPYVTLRNDEVIDALINDAMAAIENNNSNQLEELAKDPRKVLKSAGISGEYTNDGATITGKMGVADFNSDGDWKNQKYEVGISASRGTTSISASGTFIPFDPVTNKSVWTGGIRGVFTW